MNQFIFAFITILSFLNFSIQANESNNQWDECYFLENNDSMEEPYSYVEEYPCTDNGIYVGGFAGIGFLDVNNNTGFTGGLNVGYKFSFNLRVEGEFSYRYHRINGLNVTSHSFMANVLYDLPQCCKFTPYFGYGLGNGRNTVTMSSHGYALSRHVDEFVMQGIFGLSRKIWNAMHLGLEYRIYGTKDVVYDHSVVISLKRFI